jgi:hypothetical protein
MDGMLNKWSALTCILCKKWGMERKGKNVNIMASVNYLFD